MLAQAQGGTYGDFVGAMLCLLVVSVILGWAFWACLRSLGPKDPPDGGE